MLQKLNSQLQERLITTFEQSHKKDSNARGNGSYGEKQELTPLEDFSREQKLYEGALLYVLTNPFPKVPGTSLFEDRELRTVKKNGEVKVRHLKVPNERYVVRNRQLPTITLKEYLKDVSDIFNEIVFHSKMNDWLAAQPVKRVNGMPEFATVYDLAKKHKVLPVNNPFDLKDSEYYFDLFADRDGDHRNSMKSQLEINYAKYLTKTLDKKPSYFSQAYIRNKSIISNAVIHKDSEKVVQMDISSFFDTISEDEAVKSYATAVQVLINYIVENFTRQGSPEGDFALSNNPLINSYSTKVANLVKTDELLKRSRRVFALSRKVSNLFVNEYGFGLPTGSPLSPVISNMVMFNSDFRIYLELNALNYFKKDTDKYFQKVPMNYFFTWAYTRYADDITISIKHRDKPLASHVRREMFESSNTFYFQRIRDHYMDKNRMKKDAYAVEKSTKFTPKHYTEESIVKMLQRMSVKESLIITRKELQRKGLEINDGKTRVTHQEVNGFKLTGIRFNKCWTDEKDKFTIDGSKKRMMKHLVRLLYEDRIPEEEVSSVAYKLVGNMSFLKMASDGMYENFTNWVVTYCNRKYDAQLEAESLESQLIHKFTLMED